jgi:hypothetical protein
MMMASAIAVSESTAMSLQWFYIVLGVRPERRIRRVPNQSEAPSGG